jgi:UDP:flavonoid glycosyltransferase YjiC (YdhE family)
MPLARGEEGIDELFTGANKPDVLVCGYFSSLEALLLHYKYGVPLTIMTTYLRHPDDDPAMFAKTKLVYMSRAFVTHLFNTVGFTGDTIEEFIRPLEYQYPEVLPCPRELDFADDDWIHGQNVVYAEPMVLRSALGPIATTAPKPPDLRSLTNISNVIFATSGSQVQDYEAKAREFFRNLILMMQTEGMGSYFLLASVGTKLKKELEATFNGGENALPSNVMLVEWASQLEILSNVATKVVFMHGGLATIKEAIWNQVPMVIVPHGKDQLDNALRLHRLNLAMVVQQGDLSPMNLRKLLAEAMANTWMKSSIAAMKAMFSAQDGAAVANKASIKAIELARQNKWESRFAT